LATRKAFVSLQHEAPPSTDMRSLKHKASPQHKAISHKDIKSPQHKAASQNFSFTRFVALLE